MPHWLHVTGPSRGNPHASVSRSGQVCEGQEGRARPTGWLPRAGSKDKGHAGAGGGVGAHPLQTGDLSTRACRHDNPPEALDERPALDMLKVKITLLPRPACTHTALFSTHTHSSLRTF